MGVSDFRRTQVLSSQLDKAKRSRVGRPEMSYGFSQG